MRPPRLGRDRDRAQSSEQSGNHEVIRSIRLDDCRPRGQDVGQTANRHDDLTDDPNARHISAAGAQAEATTLIDGLESVDKAQRDVDIAHGRLEVAENEALRRARQRNAAQWACDDHRSRVGQAQRFPLLQDAPGWLVLTLLGLIAVGEWRLNRPPLELAGDTALGTDLLAAVLGVGLVTAAHLAGVAVRRLLDRRPDWDGVVTSPHYLTMAATVLAMAVVAVALHHLRGEFFAEVDIVAGHTPLVFVQVFLLWVAALLSLAHDNPMRAETERLQEALEGAEAILAAAVEDMWEAEAAFVNATADRRTRVSGLLEQLRLQDDHTARQLYEFAAGVQDTCGEPVVVAPSQHSVAERVQGWREWLASDVAPAPQPSAISAELLSELAGQSPAGIVPSAPSVAEESCDGDAGATVSDGEPPPRSSDVEADVDAPSRHGTPDRRDQAAGRPSTGSGPAIPTPSANGELPDGRVT